jgi:diguanylate cyclase (GGDEF)-like protein
VSDGKVIKSATMGDYATFEQRPAATRLLAAPLTLEPGKTYELMLRVHTTSTLVLPISIMQTDALIAYESKVEMLQGMAFGIALCFALAMGLRAVYMRDPIYAWFALANTAGALFFFAYHGMAAQHLWPEHAWLTRNSTPALLLMMVAFGAFFTVRALNIHITDPKTHIALRIGGIMVLATIGLFMVGAINYQAALRVGALVAPLMTVLTFPAAIRLARRGERVAFWMFAGWGCYITGIIISTGLQGGQLPANVWTDHALQIGGLCDMVTWLMVLSVRAEEAGDKARVAQREHDRLVMISQTDPLTGLLNRRGLQRALQPAIDASDATHLTAVYLIDLDGFKAVNDTHGHEAGDELLVQVGQRLRAAVRETDLVARLGGDEFVIAAPKLAGQAQVDQIGAKLLACCATPFQLTHVTATVGMTAGYATAPVQGTDAAALLKQADAAMYLGKQSGKSRIQRSLAATV